jgi:hypothetical protein
LAIRFCVCVFFYLDVMIDPFTNPNKIRSNVAEGFSVSLISTIKILVHHGSVGTLYFTLFFFLTKNSAELIFTKWEERGVNKWLPNSRELFFYSKMAFESF